MDSAKVLDSLKAEIFRCQQRTVRLQQKIDEAFAGEPFLPDLPPTAPRNGARFREYFTLHRQASLLLHGESILILKVLFAETLIERLQAGTTNNATPDRPVEPITKDILRTLEALCSAKPNQKLRRPK